ncbi:MAG TPA: hypothetical protein PLA54_08420 [Spirochaetota bacterium]|nr:hypothetical protein [Spirochaetota bacterium]
MKRKGARKREIPTAVIKEVVFGFLAETIRMPFAKRLKFAIKIMRGKI